MIPINYYGFRIRDIISRVLPGFIFSFYCLHLLSPQSELTSILSNTGDVVLLTVIAYPLGLTTEYLALAFRQLFFGKCNCLSENKLIKEYLDTDQNGFWFKYIYILSYSEPNVSAIIEQYNLTRFFFLNMTFVSMVVFIINLIVTRSISTLVSCVALLLAVVFFYCHINSNKGFYKIVGFAQKVLDSTPQKND